VSGCQLRRRRRRPGLPKDCRRGRRSAAVDLLKDLVENDEALAASEVVRFELVVADYLIAATALLLEADLLSTNVRHFPMLPGLQPLY
jgi:hypothetical protein